MVCVDTKKVKTEVADCDFLRDLGFANVSRETKKKIKRLRDTV